LPSKVFWYMVTWIHGGHGDMQNHIEVCLGFIMHKGISMNMQIDIRYVLIGTFISHTINTEANLI
jgi:hypothetical protein